MAKAAPAEGEQLLPQVLDRTSDGCPMALTEGQNGFEMRSNEYSLSFVPVTSRVAGLHISRQG